MSFYKKVMSNYIDDYAVDLIGDTGTKGAVERLISALEGFKQVEEESEDKQGVNYPEIGKISNDIEVLKSVLNKFKHVR
jgi:hypothetical protein